MSGIPENAYANSRKRSRTPSGPNKRYDMLSPSIRRDVRECSGRHAQRAIIVSKFRRIVPKRGDNSYETIPNNPSSIFFSFDSYLSRLLSESGSIYSGPHPQNYTYIQRKGAFCCRDCKNWKIPSMHDFCFVVLLNRLSFKPTKAPI